MIDIETVMPMKALLTKSLTILPSSLATTTLNTVLRIRKNECNTTIKLSLDVQEVNAIRKRIARNCLKNEASILGFVLDFPDKGGK